MVGDQFSAADCLLAPMLVSLGRFPEGAEFLGGSPILQAYLERIGERESFKATLP